MRLGFRLKHYFFSAFRELFVYHHGSLEFRAKIYTLLIAVNETINVQNYILVKQHALEVYKNDEDRANLLLLSTKEYVSKIYEKKGLKIDNLIDQIQKKLKQTPRYAKKIDVEFLYNFVDLADSDDTALYQQNIIEFLQKLKEETLGLKEQTEQTNTEERTDGSSD